MSRSIALTGMMGVGKTTVGRALAKRLGRGFVDTDAEVERATSMTIPALFDEHGEAGFRTIEAAVVRHVAAIDDLVVGLGGGVVLLDANVAELVLAGIVVHLDAPVEVLARRCVADGVDARPLLLGGDAIGRLERLHAQRSPRYAEVADLTIDASRPVDVVVEELVEWAKVKGDVLTPSELEQVL